MRIISTLLFIFVASSLNGCSSKDKPSDTDLNKELEELQAKVMAAPDTPEKVKLLNEMIHWGQANANLRDNTSNRKAVLAKMKEFKQRAAAL
jgi:hypothetical protein